MISRTFKDFLGFIVRLFLYDIQNEQLLSNDGWGHSIIKSTTYNPFCAYLLNIAALDTEHIGVGREEIDVARVHANALNHGHGRRHRALHHLGYWRVSDSKASPVYADFKMTLVLRLCKSLRLPCPFEYSLLKHYPF